MSRTMSRSNFSIIFLCQSIILLQISWTALAQMGTQCSEKKPCPPHQLCNFGYCQCQLGYVKADTFCFKLISYGEGCFFTEQCNDNRMECRFPNKTYDSKLCLCDRYHKWHEEERYCVPTVTLEAIREQESMSHKTQEIIERNAKYVFEGVVIAGIIAICVGLLFATLCVVYGCCIDHCIRPEENKCPTCQHLPKKSESDTKKEWDQVVATMSIDEAGDIF